jgi:trimethylamine--corrinoid protein Co-methyltransferase
VIFAQVASAPNCSDADRGRRPGSHADFRDLVRLAQCFDAIHMTGGYPVEPVDLHASIRHLDCLADFVTLTDKAFHAYSLGADAQPRRARDRPHRPRHRPRALEREPSLITIINSSSPLRLDAPMLQGMIEMARANQVVIMTPFTLAGRWRR